MLKNRSYRRFHQSELIDLETLRELVDLARLSASGSNLQPLKFVLCCDPEVNALVFPHTRWAGALKNWPGPAEGERPAAYIVILGDTEIGDIDPQLFVEEEEKALYAEFVQAKESFLQCLHSYDYAGAINLIGSLSPVLDTFFEKVMVMVDDEALKGNRLALLGHLYREFLKIAQFSNLQVEKAQYRSM